MAGQARVVVEVSPVRPEHAHAVGRRRELAPGEKIGAKSVAQAVLVLNDHLSKNKIQGKAVTKYGVNMAITRGDVIYGRIKITRKGKASKETKASSKVIPKGKRKLKIKKRPTDKKDDGPIPPITVPTVPSSATSSDSFVGKPTIMP